MALGLLGSKEINGALEDIGNRYFEELRSRSFFEVVDSFAYMVRMLSLRFKICEADVGMRLSDWTNRAISYGRTYGMVEHVQMHDLMHDLATYVTNEETSVVSRDDYNVSARVRFIVWMIEEDLSEGDQFPNQLLTAKRARLLAFQPKKVVCMSKSLIHNLFTTFRCLRVISLTRIVFEDLRDSVGDLKHLRLLNMSHNIKLKGLLDPICNLVNLQTLNFYFCHQLERFPRDMRRLISLRHLYFTSKLMSILQTGLHGWTSMQQLLISNCRNLAFLSEQIGTLTTLRFLQISYCPNLASLPNTINHLTALEELKIFGCGNLVLTGWEGLHGLRSLKQLNIQGLPLLVHFPDGLRNVSGSLKYLIVKVCQNLIELPECLEHCTRLLKITLYKCPGLNALPSGIQAIKTLKELWIAYCPELSPRCERDIGEDWHLISHIPMIEVDSRYIQKEGFPIL